MPIPSKSGLRALVLAGALVLSACTTFGSRQTAKLETDEAGGFTISEEVHVDAEIGAAFEEAVGLLEEGQYDRGIALLLQVTESAPLLTTAHIDLGIAYARVDDLERAEVSLKKALELNPRHPVAHNELGIVYRRTGRFQEARESYETALQVYPLFHFARRNLAILCDVYLADAKCAMKNYDLYTEAVPNDADAAMWSADLRNRIGQ